jgi:hypothetical protein
MEDDENGMEGWRMEGSFGGTLKDGAKAKTKHQLSFNPYGEAWEWTSDKSTNNHCLSFH